MKKKSLDYIVAALVGILWLAMPACALAQAVIEADTAMLQPQISRDESGFKGCGIRVVLSVLRQLPKADFYDFSINFSSSSLAGAGMVKIGKQVGDLQTKKEYSEVPGPISFWIASEQSGKAIKAKKLYDSPETKGFKLGIIDAVMGFEAMMDIAQGKRMHVAAHYAKEPIEQVIAFSGSMSENELNSFQACVNELIERWQAQLGDK